MLSTHTTSSPQPVLDGNWDALILGHYDTGFAAHEHNTRNKGLTSGDYRNLRNDFITLDGKKMSYLDVFNHINGTALHWTEMLGTASAVLCSYLARQDLRALPGSFAPGNRDVLHQQLGSGFPVVALTTTLYLDVGITTEVVEYVRHHAPESLIVVGGPFVENLHHNLDSEDLRMILEDIGADVYVLERQGEKTLAQIIQRVRNGESLLGLENCFVYHEMVGSFVFGGAIPEMVRLEESRIDWTLFPTSMIGPVVQTRTAYGCPFRCKFCDYPQRAGGLWETNDLDGVEAELEYLDQHTDATDVVFIDDTFNVPINRFVEILERMVKRQFSFRWYSYFRCNLANEKIVSLMKESGCAGVFLGVESGDDSVLKNMKKMTTTDKYRRGIKLLNKAGIPSFASLIVGFPGETEETVQNTIDFINDTAPTFYRAEIWYYNPRSPIHEDREKFAMESSAYQFRHATMDWKAACDQTLRILDQVKTSTWLPMYDLDFWSLPYLRAKGWSLEDLEGYLKICNELLADELELPSWNTRPRQVVEAELRALCGQIGHSLTQAPVLAEA